MYDYDDTYEMRVQAAAERRRLRPHWCPECRGFTQKGSPCYEEPQEEREDEQ